jgi:hypothetical protein
LLSALVLPTLLAACTNRSAAVSTPQSSNGRDVESGVIAQVNLRYQRSAVFASAGRPEGFDVIMDYRDSAVEREYPGSWDETRQLLTATVAVPLGSENLVYVSDPAIQPGATTVIDAGRGSLKEVPCPSGVDPLFACELLQVLH